VLIKYSTTVFTDGNSWSSKINDWEKPAQPGHLMIKFRCLDTAGDGAEMCKFIG
jgi:hypothetical protein